MTLRDAIDLWDSNFWRVSESENDPSILPVIEKHDLHPSVRSPFEQFGPNERLALETLLQNVLLAFLTHENRRRFYILAPSQVVTALIWGLAHCLPHTLRWMSEITFTTYDDDVKVAGELIVGTFRFANSPSQDLPDACYKRGVLALNIDSETFQIRRASSFELDANPLYANFATYAAKCLVNCSTETLSRLVQDAERRLIKSLPAFLNLYEQDINGKPLLLEQILLALRQKTFEEEQLGKPKNLNVLIGALIKSSSDEKVVEGALKAFCQRADGDVEATAIRKVLISNVADAINTRVDINKSTGIVEFFRLVQTLVYLAPVVQYMSLWLTLLNAFSQRIQPPNHQFPWETRQLFLLQWADLAKVAQVPDSIVGWLNVPWSEMERLLTLPIPQEWQFHALMKRIEEFSELPAAAQIVIEKAETLCLQVLEQLMAHNNERQATAVVHFLTQLLQLKYHKRLFLLLKILETDKIGHVTTYILPEVPTDDLCTFVEEYLYKLMPYVVQQHTAWFIEQCIDDYFANLPPENLLTSPATRNLLANLSRILTLPLSDELRARILCWQEIAKFLETDIDAVQRGQIHTFASALARGGLSPETRRLLSDTLATLLANRDFGEEPGDLTIFVYLLGKVLNGQASFLESMSMIVGERFGRSIRTISEYISLVLYENYFTSDLEKERFLKNSLNYLLIQIGSGDEREFQKIQRRVEDLSTPAEIATWQKFLASSRLASGWARMPWYTFWMPAYWQSSRSLPRPRTAPWYMLWLPSYRKSRTAHKKVRETIRGRMVTEIAEVASMLDKPVYLTEYEQQIVRAAQIFTQAYNQEDAQAIASSYQQIWETYYGEIYFKNEEMLYIREIMHEYR
jgi:hypothetical protein